MSSYQERDQIPRSAKSRLRTREKVERRALFLCTDNSCRSQMAEGLLRALAGDEFEAHSAGARAAFSPSSRNKSLGRDWS